MALADSPRERKGAGDCVESVCRLQRRIDMMERLMGDCVIILSGRDPGHMTMEYSDEDVGIGNNLLDLCYKIAGDDLRKED